MSNKCNTCETSPLPPRSGEMFVAVGCAYSRHPRYRMQNQPHPGGVQQNGQQNVESSACGTPPGCDVTEQSIPWVARIRTTHGYQYYTTPWCGTSMLARRGGSPALPSWRIKYCQPRHCRHAATPLSPRCHAAVAAQKIPVLPSCRLVALSLEKLTSNI
jgi:hypothetical protein